eukprot:SAG31_NODE_8154_length_1507_cov_8.022416_1_plen_183_part_00
MSRMCACHCRWRPYGCSWGSPVSDAIFLREMLGPGRLPSREVRGPIIDNGRLAVLGDVSLHAGPTLVEPRSRCCGGRIGACCRRRLRVRTQDVKASHTPWEHCGAEPWGHVQLTRRFRTVAFIIPPTRKWAAAAAAVSTKRRDSAPWMLVVGWGPGMFGVLGLDLRTRQLALSTRRRPAGGL